MGTDCAPLIADLFLKNLTFSVARKFSKAFRYIDDLLTLNNSQFEKSIPTFSVARKLDDLLTLNNSQFEKSITNIYPKELELKKTTESSKHCSYLDLHQA